MPLDWFKTGWNQTVHFGAGRPGGKHMLAPGWTAGERDRTWTQGQIARLAFRLPDPEHETSLILDLSPFIDFRGAEQQTVEIHLNGRRVETGQSSISDRTLFVIPIDRGVFYQNPLSVVSLILPDAQSPASIDPGSHDFRRLGVALYSLRWADIWYDYQTGQRIFTDASHQFFRYLLSGWSHPEPGFIWTEGPAAQIMLRLGEKPAPMLFKAKIHAFVPSPGLPPIVISAFANGRFAGESAFPTSETAWLEIPIGRDSLRDDGMLLLRLDIHTPRSPRDLGLGLDERQLGFAMSQFVLEAASLRRTAPRQDHSSAMLFAEMPWSSESQSVHIPPCGEAFDRSNLVYGWDEPDSNGFPLSRNTAILGVDLSSHSGSRLCMECDLQYCGAEPAAEVQIRVLVNEIEAAVWVGQGNTPGRYSATVWPSMIRTEGRTYVRFEWNGAGETPAKLVIHHLHFSPMVLHQGPLVRCSAGETIHFGADPKGEDVLGEGWTYKDSEGVWNHGDKATLMFALGEARLPMSVQFELGSFQPDDRHLSIEVNGRTACLVEARGIQTASVEIVPDDILDYHWLEFCFQAAPPVSELTNRQIDSAVLAETYANPSYGTHRIAFALAGKGVLVTESQVRQMWDRLDLATFRKRLTAAGNAAMPGETSYTFPAKPECPRFQLRSMVLQPRSRH